MIAGRAALVGIGSTDFMKDSGRTRSELAASAVLDAIYDAGLTVDEVDGLVGTYWGPVQDTVPPAELARTLGLDGVRFQLYDGVGGFNVCGMVTAAAAAVDAGICRAVVVYRAANGRSERAAPAAEMPGGSVEQWRVPFGHFHAATNFGPRFVAHMARYGTTHLDLGRIAVAQRDNALLNAKAQMRTPLTLEQHRDAPAVVDPYRLFDCCLQSDVAQAVVVSSVERARDLRHTPVTIAAVGGQVRPADVPLWQMNTRRSVDELYAQADATPGDLDFAQLYDPFTGTCLIHMDGFGLASEGELSSWLEGGGHLLDGTTPVNTHGGLLSEGHAFGLNHVVEAVQQLRPAGVRDDLCTGGHDFDRSHCRQVRDARLGLVCAEDGESSLLLRRG